MVYARCGGECSQTTLRVATIVIKNQKVYVTKLAFSFSLEMARAAALPLQLPPHSYYYSLPTPTPRPRPGHSPYSSSPNSSTARNASCGTSTRPTCFIRFLPSFCLASSFFVRVMSPP